MKRSRSKAVGGFFLAALIFSPVWGSVPPQPGTVNYIEGQAAIGAEALTDKSVGTVKLAAGQSLSTEDGRAEILLTPGIFLRVGDHSSLQMISPGLADTIMALQKGRAMIEVADIRPENNVRIAENGSSTQLQKAGLYDFDADRGLIRVFDGKAVVQAGGRQIEVKSGRQLNLNAAGKLKAQKFDKKAYMDDFYRWASLRSSYLADANVDAARTYAGGGGSYPGGWYGDGWYWDAGFDAYTFIPGDGIFYDPFGWGFYSPGFAFAAPYFGFGLGYGYGYGGGRYHHFGPGYHPGHSAGGRSTGFAGHAYSVGRSGFGSASRSGFGGGGSAAVAVVADSAAAAVAASAQAAGGFHGGGGGGFHGGGGGGGGFHGGGGGGHGR